MEEEKGDLTNESHALYKHTDMREGIGALSEGICWVSVGHFRSVKNCGHWNKR